MGLNNLFKKQSNIKVVNANPVKVENQGNVIQTDSGNAIPLFQKTLPMALVTLNLNQFRLPKVYLTVKDSGITEVNCRDDFGKKTQNTRKIYRIKVVDGEAVAKALKQGMDTTPILENAITLDISNSNIPPLEESNSLITLIKPQVMLGWHSAFNSGSYVTPKLVCENIKVLSDDEITSLIEI